MVKRVRLSRKEDEDRGVSQESDNLDRIVENETGDNENENDLT